VFLSVEMMFRISKASERERKRNQKKNLISQVELHMMEFTLYLKQCTTRCCRQTFIDTCLVLLLLLLLL
jgi:hypothetical protein